MNATKSTTNVNASDKVAPSSSHYQVITVPTFRAKTNNELRPSISSDVLKEQDPFLYFSNQERRMSYLTRNTAVAAAEHKDKKPRGVEERRKTCISFELHPDLLLGDLLLDDDMDDELEDDDQRLTSEEEDLLFRLVLGISQKRTTS